MSNLPDYLTYGFNPQEAQYPVDTTRIRGSTFQIVSVHRDKKAVRWWIEFIKEHGGTIAKYTSDPSLDLILWVGVKDGTVIDGVRAMKHGNGHQLGKHTAAHRSLPLYWRDPHTLVQIQMQLQPRIRAVTKNWAKAAAVGRGYANCHLWGQARGDYQFRSTTPAETSREVEELRTSGAARLAAQHPYHSPAANPNEGLVMPRPRPRQAVMGFPHLIPGPSRMRNAPSLATNSREQDSVEDRSNALLSPRRGITFGPTGSPTYVPPSPYEQ